VTGACFVISVVVSIVVHWLCWNGYFRRCTSSYCKRRNKSLGKCSRFLWRCKCSLSAEIVLSNYAYMYVHMQTHTYTHAHTYTHKLTNKPIPWRGIYTHINTYIYIHIHILIVNFYLFLSIFKKIDLFLCISLFVVWRPLRCRSRGRWWDWLVYHF